MDLTELVDIGLILTDLDTGDKVETIRALGNLLLSGGYVEGGFVEAVLEREKEFPTGLPTKAVEIALPHTEAEYVRTSKMAVGVLRTPVDFQMMGSPESLVHAKIVFLLAIGEKESQVIALQQLVQLFQDGCTLDKISNAHTPAEVKDAFLGGVRYQQGLLRGA